MALLRKSQAALEFLITYGWAILAATVAIGALIYFGTTNPAGHLPDKCIFGNSFECTDYKIAINKIQFKIVNGLGQTIYSPSVKITDSVTNCDMDTIDWPSDSIREVNCTIATPYIKTDRIRVKFDMYYLKKPTGYNQSTVGEIYTTVQ